MYTKIEFTSFADFEKSNDFLILGKLVRSGGMNFTWRHMSMGSNTTG